MDEVALADVACARGADEVAVEAEVACALDKGARAARVACAWDEEAIDADAVRAAAGDKAVTQGGTAEAEADAAAGWNSGASTLSPEAPCGAGVEDNEDRAVQSAAPRTEGRQPR